MNARRKSPRHEPSSWVMAAIERTLPAIRPATDRHVFAAATARRARILWTVGIGAGLLALAWLVALALALLGAGTLPGVLPADVAHRGHHAQSNRTPAHQPQSPTSRAPEQASARPQEPAARATRSASANSVRSTAPAASTPAPAVAATPVVTPQTPVSRGQGWARRGWTEPPGHARKPPPVKDKHQADGSTRTTAPGQSGSHSPKKG
jgi:hypothetical protein